jgi:hypothetical protein
MDKRGKRYRKLEIRSKKMNLHFDLYDRVYFNPIKRLQSFRTASESINNADNLDILPKSISWQLIKQYYLGFYSAHLILRFRFFTNHNLRKE